MSGGLCRHCGAVIKKQRLVFCSRKCLVANDRAERKSLREEIRYKPEPKPERKEILTDVEQRRINLEIDAKYHVALESRRIRPGDPEFEAIAAQCTQPANIKRDSCIDGYERNMARAPKMMGRIRIS